MSDDLKRREVQLLIADAEDRIFERISRMEEILGEIMRDLNNRLCALESPSPDPIVNGDKGASDE